MGRKPEPSRKQLMVAAIDGFARQGYQGTSIDRIAKEAGVTKGAVYCHFRDKEELLLAAVKDRIDGFEQHFLRGLEPGQDPVSALRRAADSCFFHATVSNHRRFIITLMVEALDTHPRLSAEFRQMMRRFRSFLARAMRAGQEQGVFRADVVPERAASVLMGGIMGAEIEHYQDPEEVDLRRVLDELIEQTIAWLAAPRASKAASGGVRAW
jgi:TetR/AcrR family acrAB operon transcriptional repressor